MDWLKAAMSLPHGHTARMDCWHCHGKNSMGLSNLGEVFTYHCFRCKEKDAKPAPPMTPQERRAMQLEAEAFQAKPPELPDDFTTDIPPAGILWLSKGGLNHSDIARLGFGYSPRMKRVIMPVYEGRELVAVQARALHREQEPKYLGQIRQNPRPAFVAPHRQPTDVLVLTEDMLSAARVSKVADAWSLLGTNLGASVLARIGDSHYTRVAVWMDDDEAGINARRKMRGQLQLLGKEVSLIQSDRDPKKHSLEEIRRLVWA